MTANGIGGTPIPASGSDDAKVIELTRSWEIGEQIGKGGFGRVFLATADDGSRAAAKFIPQKPGADRELLFVQLDGVRNVVPILDHGASDGEWVLVMPLAEKSLEDHLKDSGALSAEQTVSILSDIAAALSDLETLESSVVHRDLKPGNILLVDGTWCLADFGLARYAEAATASQTHKNRGSAPYVAPERWRGARATAAVDVYAVGVMAHELLTGQLPFAGPDFAEQHLADEPPRVSAPPRLVALIEECLYKAPQARPSPTNLAARLARVNSTNTPGVSALADAYQKHAEKVAGHEVARSREQVEQERRTDLIEAAELSMNSISSELLEVVRDAAPTATVQHRPEGWKVTLGSASLGLSAVKPFDGRSWGWEAPALDVVAYATITVVIPAGRQNFEGRSHSLYFCDAKQQGTYGWSETAFMISPMIGKRGRQNPFALEPGEEAAKALWTGMAEYQVAWPFTPLVVGELSEFIDRWTGYFGLAVSDQLTHPSTMPERSPEGTWRQR